jgi:hypothetical protein
MKNINDYIDNFNMITTLQKDGGDSCAHGCAILYGNYIVSTPPNIPQINLNAYTHNLDRPHGYVRHPDPTKWYSNPKTFSRDQLTPLLCLLGLVHSIRLFDLFVEHLKRGLCFAWNTQQDNNIPGWKLPDVTGPDIWGAWIRAFRIYPLWPLLLVFDIPTLVGSMIYRTGLSSSTIQMNQVLMTDFSTRVMPTPTSWLAKKIYGKTTPINALNQNWGDATPFNPPVNQYLVPVIEEW